MIFNIELFFHTIQWVQLGIYLIWSWSLRLIIAPISLASRVPNHCRHRYMSWKGRYLSISYLTGQLWKLEALYCPVIISAFKSRQAKSSFSFHIMLKLLLSLIFGPALAKTLEAYSVWICTQLIELHFSKKDVPDQVRLSMPPQMQLH